MVKIERINPSDDITLKVTAPRQVWDNIRYTLNSKSWQEDDLLFVQKLNAAVGED